MQKCKWNITSISWVDPLFYQSKLHDIFKRTLCKQFLSVKNWMFCFLWTKSLVPIFEMLQIYLNLRTKFSCTHIRSIIDYVVVRGRIWMKLTAVFRWIINLSTSQNHSQKTQFSGYLLSSNRHVQNPVEITPEEQFSSLY